MSPEERTMMIAQSMSKARRTGLTYEQWIAGNCQELGIDPTPVEPKPLEQTLESIYNTL